MLTSTPLLFQLTLTSAALAQAADVPHVDIETLGVYRRIADAVDEPIDSFSEEHWIQDGEGMSALSYRYEIAFAAYGVAAVAERTPAYRAPYQRTLDRLIQKMLHEDVWGYWLDAEWGGKDPLHPYNIMYTGHLQLMLTLYRKVTGDWTYDAEFDVSESGISTSLGALAADLHALTLDNLDSSGEHYYGISCETGMVFVPCNTPHSYGQLVLDVMDGTEYAVATDAWLGWAQQNMMDPETGTFYATYYPFDSPPEIDTSPVGIYNAWILTFTSAMDHDWTLAAYEDFKRTFVEEDAWGAGYTIVRNTPGVVDFEADVGSTAFGMVAARELGDEEMFESLLASSDLILGGRSWSDDGRTYGYDSPLIPTVVANLHLLWAGGLAPGYTMRENAARGWSMARFQQPTLDEVTNPDAFVTQAWYDGETLTVTVTGGYATTDAAELPVVGFTQRRGAEVALNESAYTDWSWQDDVLVVATPGLSSEELSFSIRPPQGTSASDSGNDSNSGTPDQPSDAVSAEPSTDGCACSAGALTPAWILLAPLLAVPSRRRALPRVQVDGNQQPVPTKGNRPVTT